MKEMADDNLNLEMSIEDRLKGLTLAGEEADDLNFSDELDGLIKEVHWLTLFRVHTTKPFSHAALFTAMRIAWAAAKEVTFKALGENMFLVQAQCLGDWNRIMEGGPWFFCGALMVLEEYDRFTNINDYKLNKIPVWACIQALP